MVEKEMSFRFGNDEPWLIKGISRFLNTGCWTRVSWWSCSTNFNTVQYVTHSEHLLPFLALSTAHSLFTVIASTGINEDTYTDITNNDDNKTNRSVRKHKTKKYSKY